MTDENKSIEELSKELEDWAKEAAFYATSFESTQAERHILYCIGNLEEALRIANEIEDKFIFLRERAIQ